MDVHDRRTRSYNMSRIKGKDTKPELIVRKFLFGEGFRYRLHVRSLPGKPDLVFPKYRAVIFVHGCFWHGHKGCKYFVPPKTRIEWWINKINSTKKKDVKNALELKKQGWKVISVWECSLKSDKRYKTLALLEDKIRNG
jgi:DNA mismatch endonuclease (patch repair protein)